MYHQCVINWIVFVSSQIRGWLKHSDTRGRFNLAKKISSPYFIRIVKKNVRLSFLLKKERENENETIDNSYTFNALHSCGKWISWQTTMFLGNIFISILKPLFPIISRNGYYSFQKEEYSTYYWDIDNHFSIP